MLCNYCLLKKIRKSAKKAGKKVTVLRDAAWGLGGVNVYVHPPSVNIKSLQGGEDGERAKYRRAWLAEVSTHCVC